MNFPRITSIFVGIVAAIFVLQACQDNNFVGSSFIPNNNPVVVDTLILDQFELVDLNSFTGNLTRLTAGRYVDPLFGTFTSDAYMMPGLISDTIALNVNQDYYLIMLASDFYGDTTAVADFDLHFVDERWRASLITPDTELATRLPLQPVQFSVSVENDSVEVKLPQEWVERYIDISESEDRTERLANEEFGFAIKPQPQLDNLLVGFRTGFNAMRIVVRDQDIDDGLLNDEDGDEEEEEEPELRIPFRGWAFNSIQTNVPAGAENVIAIRNNFKSALRFDLDLDQFKTENITRFELVMYEDSLTMAQTYDDPFYEHHVRPSTQRLSFYQLGELDLDYLVISNPIFTPEKSINLDRSFRVNLTSTIKNLALGGRLAGDFYITSQTNNGLIFPYALVKPDNQNQPERAPKIIITYVVPEVN